MVAKLLTLVIFSKGLLIGFSIFLLLMATEDIVAGTLIQSSFVMTLYGTGSLLGKLIGPFLVRWIKLPKSVFLTSLFWLTSWLLIVVGNDANTRLVGAFAVGVFYGLSNTICLCVLSLYDNIERHSSAYLAGNSVSAFVIGFLYTGE